MSRPHLKLVKTAPDSPRTTLVDRSQSLPWALMGLLAATLVAPFVRVIGETLAVYEDTDSTE